MIRNATLVLSAALWASGCGGSSSETPFPVPPLPSELAPAETAPLPPLAPAPTSAAPAREVPEAAVEDAAVVPPPAPAPAPVTWGSPREENARAFPPPGGRPPVEPEPVVLSEEPEGAVAPAVEPPPAPTGSATAPTNGSTASPIRNPR